MYSKKEKETATVSCRYQWITENQCIRQGFMLQTIRLTLATGKKKKENSLKTTG